MSSIPFDVFRKNLDRLADHIAEWQGIPVPIEEMPLRLHDRHPLAEFYRGIDGVEIPMLVGGPELDDDEDEVIVNSWTDQRRSRRVYVMRRLPSGRAFVLVQPLPPDGAMDRLTLWLNTLGASDAWMLDAEHKAREKLRGLLSERQWRHYDLTGSFLETSTRSRLTYVFRRLRPTIALSERWKDRPGRTPPDQMRCLAVLCLHPIGYYQRSWAGCLTPSDDVIAHLTMMRADEAYFWRCANQHDPASPEAGL